MPQSNSLPEVRLVCLMPPERTKALPASTQQKRLEEFKAFLNSICQSTTCKLDEQELEHFLEWSILPWSIVQLPHMQRYKEYVIDAIKQYKQFIKNNSQVEDVAFKDPSNFVETPLIPFPLDAKDLPQSSEGHQLSSIEENSVILARELMVQLQAVIPTLERWRSYLENNKNYALSGGLHSYHKNGKLCWNYCPPEVDTNSKRKDKRRYVRQKQVDAYRKAISLGKQLKHARALEQQLTAFADAMRSLL